MNPQATSRLVLKGGLGYLRKHISNQTSNPYLFPPNEDELMDIKQSVLDIWREEAGMMINLEIFEPSLGFLSTL